MEQHQENSLFELSLDQTGKSHIGETARWAKFLAICGMVMCVLMVIVGIVASMAVSRTVSSYEGYRYRSADTSGLGATMVITYVVIALIYFFPCLFTLRFANHTTNAIKANDQASLNEGLKNLKVTFRYMGIITIIFLAFMLLGLLMGGLGALMGGFN